jgi:hypothetical protein
LKKLLGILESTVKILGYGTKWVQDEIVKESNCEIFAKLIISTPHEEVREKMMSLIKIWAFMFKDPAKYCALEVSLVDVPQFLPKFGVFFNYRSLGKNNEILISIFVIFCRN